MSNNEQWQKILQSFDLFEQKLESNPEDEYLDTFFDNLDKELQSSNLEKWQWEEARDRTKRVIDKLAKMKESIQQESIELIKSRAQFDAYYNNMSLHKK